MKLLVMYTFRFNPVFNQWVVLGGVVPSPLSVQSGHLLNATKAGDFIAAAHPKPPFILEPPTKKAAPTEPLLYISQPPVGEYELLLYRGQTDLFSWSAKEWQGWLNLIGQRIYQLHHNPYLHFLSISLHTGARHTIEGYVRAGDFIATSHPVAGMSLPLSTELAKKITEKEDLFVVEESKSGCLYVPSAPLHDREVWYLPKVYRSGVEEVSKEEQKDVARLLSVLFPALNKEFPNTNFVLTVHTSVAGMSEDSTWWLQIHQAEQQQPGALAVRPLPESFAQQLHFLLDHHTK